MGSSSENKIGSGGKGKNNNEKKKTKPNTKPNDNTMDDILESKSTLSAKSTGSIQNSKKKTKKEEDAPPPTFPNDETDMKNSKDKNDEHRKDVEDEQQQENQEKEEHSEGKSKDDNDEGILTETSFESLGVVEPLCQACQRLGWKYATKIQQKVLPEALQGKDIIGLAETGSGKTGAFCLPLLQDLLENPPSSHGGTAGGGSSVFAVILAPTRELAFQIHQVVEGLGHAIGATSLCIVGGVPMTQQSIALGRNPHILVATPGRLVDHLTNTKGFHLRNLKYLILDEADRMLSLDFEQELNEILQVIPDERRTLLFSATMTSKVQKLQRACLSNPVKVEVSTKFQTPKQLLQSYLFIPAKYKDCYLTYLINEHAGQSILVFGATCHNVQRLALMLRNLGFPALCLHGQMSQPKRLGALHKFTSGARSILICTDVASRGLDIPHVDVVINFDLPGHGKDYIHRVGRTARAGNSGKAIAMVTQYDVEVYQRLEGLLGRKLDAYNENLEEETVLILLERVNEAQRLATRELKEQLAAAADSSGGRRKRKSSRDNDDDGGGGGDGDLEGMLQKEIKKNYQKSSSHQRRHGGSGGKGGALPNQRGSGRQSKKYKHHK